MPTDCSKPIVHFTPLARRVLAIACGWEDLNDHATLRNDQVLQLATDRNASAAGQRVDYIVGLAKNPALTKLAATLMVNAENAFNEAGQKQRLFGEFTYAAGTWDKQRRVIARIEHSDKGENPCFVVTSLAGDGQQPYEDTYCGRGEVENRIKEQQLGLFADRTRCHDFVANQFRLLLRRIVVHLSEPFPLRDLFATLAATLISGSSGSSGSG